jgi:hypothetical protein
MHSYSVQRWCTNQRNGVISSVRADSDLFPVPSYIAETSCHYDSLEAAVRIGGQCLMARRSYRTEQNTSQSVTAIRELQLRVVKLSNKCDYQSKLRL